MSGFIRTRAYLASYPKVEQVERPDLVRYYNLKEILANHISTCLFGKGIQIDFKKEVLETHKAGIKRLREILKMNNFAGLMHETEKRVSINAVSYITAEWHNGNPMLGISAIDFPHGYGKQGFQNEIAVIWKRGTFDVADIPNIEVWTKKTLRRIMLRDDTAFIMPMLNEKERTIASSNRQLSNWKHNLGFLPVWQVKNKPNWGLVADPDDSAVEPLQLLVDTMSGALAKELHKNQTRVITTMNEAQQSKISKEMVSDYIFNIGNRSDLIKDPVNVIMGDPKIASYISGIQSVINQYFQLSGYNPILVSETGVEKSATQTYSENSLTIQSIRNKRHQRLELIRDILEKVIILENKFGMGDIFPDIDDILINIPENNVVSTEDLLRRAQVEVPLGITPKSKFNKIINENTAEEVKEEMELVKKEKEEELDLQQTQEMKFPANEGIKNNNPIDSAGK